MAYFNQNFIQFFKDLSKNNHKEWFDANRKTYTKEVKEPFADFVDELISRVQKHEPNVRITAKEAVFRINKDIRFSKDKTPYKTFVSANISEYGRKDKSYPGIYIELSADYIKVYGGAYMLETATLQNLRNYIAQNLSAFQSAKSQKDFVEKFGTIKGEQHKRLSDEFKSIAEKEPLIANKQFYFQGELDKQFLLSDQLSDKIMEYYEASLPISSYLRKGLKSKG